MQTAQSDGAAAQGTRTRKQDKPRSLIVQILFYESPTSERMIRILNWILAMLLLSILLIFAIGLGSIHVYVLLFLTLGLLASVNWCAGCRVRSIDGVRS